MFRVIVLLVLPVGVAVEVFRAVTRRRLVEEWVAENGWILRRLRYRFEPLGWNWLVYYTLEAVDPAGRELRGVVQATGFIRRNVRWSDRAADPSP